MEGWKIVASILIALITGGGLAYLAAPGSERLAFRRKDRDAILARLEALEKEVVSIRSTNRFLTAGITALVMHSDAMRAVVLRHEPTYDLKTAAQILAEARANLDGLD